MFNQKKIIILAATALLTLTALGCKKETPANNQPPVNVEANNQAVTNDNEFPIVNANANEALNQPNENIAEQINATNQQQVEQNLNQIEQQGQNEVQATENETVLALADKIAEIYGTFTNKDKEPYKNLKTVKTYSTDKMKKYLENQIAQPQDQQAPFYGVTTKTVSSAIVDSKDKDKTALVTTKREEITAQNNKPTVKYQLLKLEFVKDGEEWKLNGAYWL